MQVKKVFVAVAALLVLAGVGWRLSRPADGQSPGRAQGHPPVTVTAAEVQRRNLPVSVTALGTVVPDATVSVRSRVDGPIVAVGFREGETVKPGQMLFQIDPRPFQALLDQAQGNLGRDRAQLDSAKANVARYSALARRDVVSRQQLEQAQATLGTVQAAIRADEALVENARLQLDYTTIRAPIGGRTGLVKIDLGNVVKAHDDVLVVINRIQPIEVDFAVPERFLGAIRDAAAKGTLPVLAGPPGAEGGLPERNVAGKLTFIDNTVDPGTAGIHLLASFANTDEFLWPGELVAVDLELGREPNALVVPEEAVQEGQFGTHVFVIGPDLTVEERAVTVSRIVHGEAVIAKGLAAGERVVVEGKLRLISGAKVHIRAAAAADPAPGRKTERRG